MILTLLEGVAAETCSQRTLLPVFKCQNTGLFQLTQNVKRVLIFSLAAMSWKS